MDKTIAVLGGYTYRIPFRWLGYELANSASPVFKNPKDIALVVFTGGEDVHPSLYGGADKGISSTNVGRDAYEKAVFNQCRQYNIKMAGICRGFQFLNVMAGGQMYQHLEKHALWGRHPAYFPFSGEILPVSSTHHQLVKLSDGSIPLAWALPKRSDIYYGPDALPIEDVDKEIEGALFPNINAMGVQYHPEMMAHSEPGCKIFLDIVADFLSLPTKELIAKYERRLNHERRIEGAPKIRRVGGKAAR